MEEYDGWGTKGKGSYDFGARIYYSPFGRFDIMDPLAHLHFNTSPYAFCGNNPVNRIDPDGMDWIRNSDTDELKWVDDISSVENTPNGYTYVGANDADILTDLGVSSNYPAQRQDRAAVSFISGDNKTTPASTNLGVALSAGIPTGEKADAQGNISISVNIGVNEKNATQNNKIGKTFEGVIIRGSLTQREGQNMAIGGTLNVVNNGQSRHGLLVAPSGDNFRPEGMSVTGARIRIPAVELSPGSLTRATISAGTLNNALLYIDPVKIYWNLQKNN